MKVIKAEEAKRISNLQFNEDLFNEYLERINFLIYRRAMRNKTSACIDNIETEKYAIKIVDFLKANGYRAYLTVGGRMGSNKAIYSVYCHWD